MVENIRIPRHVAIIMDGNGRWAEARGLPRTEGHRRGAESVRKTVRTARRNGVGYLTLYAFSVANWARPPAEVSVLMQLLAHFARSEREELREQGIRLAVIGNPDRLPAVARVALEETMAYTADCKEMVLSLALSYGGRDDLVRAARELAARAAAGTITADQITEESLQQNMSTAGLPAVDLLIRTGGVSRVSDFLLFESAYAELQFLPVMWPEFDEATLCEAFKNFNRQERRFGLTSAQLRGAMEVDGDAGPALHPSRRANCPTDVPHSERDVAVASA